MSEDLIKKIEDNENKKRETEAQIQDLKELLESIFAEENEYQQTFEYKYSKEQEVVSKERERDIRRLRELIDEKQKELEKLIIESNELMREYKNNEYIKERKIKTENLNTELEKNSREHIHQELEVPVGRLANHVDVRVDAIARDFVHEF